MKGISYITDRENQKTAVIIDIKALSKYSEDVQDLLDGLIAESRKDDEKIPLSAVIKRLKRAWK